MPAVHLSRTATRAVIALALACGCAWIGFRRTSSARRQDEGKPARVAEPLPAIPPADFTPRPSLVEELGLLEQHLKRATSDAERAAFLANTTNALRSASRRDAVAAVLSTLAHGGDAPTGMSFQVGPKGTLASSPTLRVWMLEQLSLLDANAAAKYAQEIYRRHGSADEWAIALRNDWRTAVVEGRIESVRARALELLADNQWAQSPSAGYLEAIDLIVATMAWEAVPRLEQWLAPPQPKALRHGAWLTLDRLALEAPQSFLPLLAENREWLASQPLLRAGLLARADLADEREHAAVERYLERSDVTTEEGRTFFELLPNVNATTSFNLVTTSRLVSAVEAARLDQAALKAVRTWKTRPELSRWQAELTAAESRIGGFAASASRGGYLQP